MNNIHQSLAWGPFCLLFLLVSLLIQISPSRVWEQLVHVYHKEAKKTVGGLTRSPGGLTDQVRTSFSSAGGQALPAEAWLPTAFSRSPRGPRRASHKVLDRGGIRELTTPLLLPMKARLGSIAQGHCPNGSANPSPRSASTQGKVESAMQTHLQVAASGWPRRKMNDKNKCFQWNTPQ